MKKQKILDALCGHVAHNVAIRDEDGINFADGETWYRVEVECLDCETTLLSVTEWGNDR